MQHYDCKTPIFGSTLVRKLFSGTVPANDTLFGGTVQPINTQFGRTVLTNSKLYGVRPDSYNHV